MFGLIAQLYKGDEKDLTVTSNQLMEGFHNAEKNNWKPWRFNIR